MFAKPIASFEDLAAPAVELNKIALGYTERLVEMNIAGLRKQADAALGGWREALAVKDPAAVGDYLNRQGAAARAVVEGYVADAKALASLNQEVAKEMGKVVQGSISKTVKLAA